jgi:hypothetical protein
MKRTGLVIVLGCLMVGAGLFVGQTAWAQAVSLPGLNAADDFPNGCVSCHKVGSDGDQRLTVLLAAKKHVNIAALVRTVPEGCIVCHKEGGQAAPLNTHTHWIHYINPEKNRFVTEYRGSCLACHTLDLKTGIVKQKTGPKNW